VSFLHDWRHKAGREEGYAEGHEEGFNEGYEKGFEDGQANTDGKTFITIDPQAMVAGNTNVTFATTTSATAPAAGGKP
jgi:flagellar biosynthesis/type III secretory pathway protein FliH